VSCSKAASEPPTERVAVVGDSITFLSTNDIETALGSAGYDATVVGRIGKTAGDVHGDVDAAARQHPDIVLFELGTNDATRSANGQGSALAFEMAMQHYIDELKGSCLVATTVTEHRPSLIENRTAAAINAWIETHFTHVVDWDTYEWTRREAGVALVKDDVHPNGFGQAALAELDLDAVRQCTGVPNT
jgi:lysophospholipase L1-like esterase